MVGKPLGHTFDQRVAEREGLREALAYSAARADIECVGRRVKAGERGGSGWYEADIASARGDEYQAWIERAVRYLDLSGLIVRDPKRPSVVRVLDREPRA